MYLEILENTELRTRRLEDMKEIFFLSASAAIQSAPSDQQETFWSKWTSFYIENCRDELFFACDLTSKRTMGYLTGCHDSANSQDAIKSNIKSFVLFADYFTKYPAHFHINTHPDFRDHGVGTFLLQEYLIELKKMKIHGVHIVTAPGARNVNFYLKNKFEIVAERFYADKPLLLMGLLF